MKLLFVTLFVLLAIYGTTRFLKSWLQIDNTKSLY